MFTLPSRLFAILTVTGSILVAGPFTGAAPAAMANPPADPQATTSDSAAYPGDDFLPNSPAARQAEPPAPRIETHQRERPVAPGVTLRSFDRYGPDTYTATPNWLQADSLTVDLTKGTTVDYLFPGEVAKGESLSVQAERASAVAAVNGDFFDINNSTAALGVGIQSGNLIQSPAADETRWHSSAAIFTPDGLGAIGEVFFQGKITLPDRTLPLTGVNRGRAWRAKV